MRIRRNPVRLLRSSSTSASAPAPTPAPTAVLPSELLLPTMPPPPPLSCSAPPGSLTGAGSSSRTTTTFEICQLSRSPWDLLTELNLIDPQWNARNCVVLADKYLAGNIDVMLATLPSLRFGMVAWVEDEILDDYFVHVPSQPSLDITAAMPGSSKGKGKSVLAAVGGDGLRSQREVANKALMKIFAISQDMLEDQSEVEEQPKPKVWKNKKTEDWTRRRKVKVGQSAKTPSAYNMSKRISNSSRKMASNAVVPALSVSMAAATPKSAASLKPKKKKPAAYNHDIAGSNGFLYYAGYGPPIKRPWRANMHNSVSPMQEEAELLEDTMPTNQVDHGDDTARAAVHDEVSSWDNDITTVVGINKVSRDSDVFDACGGDLKGNGEHRVNSGGDIKKTSSWKKQCRRSVEVKSLKLSM
ncbi:hypothetical protein ACP4OV_006476 [Aristida adscensionis]